jgi:hypothetical protein
MSGFREKRIGNGGERPADDDEQRFLRRRLLRLDHDQATARRRVRHGVPNTAAFRPREHAVGAERNVRNVSQAGIARQPQRLRGVVHAFLHRVEIPLVPVPHVAGDDVAAKIGGAETGLRPEVIVVEDIEPPVVVVNDRIVRADSFEMDPLFIDRVLRDDGEGRSARSGKDGAGEKCQQN